MSECLETVKDAVVGMEDMDITGLVQECLDQGLAPIDIIENGLNKGLEVVGEKFEAGVFFLADLILAGEIVKGAMTLLQDKMDAGGTSRKGKVILATVAGDFHDIGKNILATILSASGYEIVDLGVDVPTDTIISSIPKDGPSLLGLSVLPSVCHRAERSMLNNSPREGRGDSRRR